MRLVLGAACVVLGAAGAFACSDGSAAPASSAPVDNDLIGGVDAKGHGLDAVGAIVLADDTQTIDYCNGTLIAPKLVLTSKRCAVQDETVTPDGGAATTEKVILPVKYPAYFITGADITSPSHKVRITGVEMCAPDVGGMDGSGCNLAVFRLQDAITDIAPLPLTDKAMGQELVGQRFSTVAYGDGTIDKTKQLSGTRRAGSLTLRAVSGSALKAVYPTVNDFLGAWTKAEGQASTTQLSASLQQYYEGALMPDLEAWLGGAPGDAQTCTSDQGAPLLARNADGKLTVFGVAGSSIGVQTKCVPVGAPYAMLGATAQAFIAKNLVDPCENETEVGRCEGDVAVRCTGATEGDRRVTRSDCAAVLQHCVAPSATNLQVSCAD